MRHMRNIKVAAVSFALSFVAFNANATRISFTEAVNAWNLAYYPSGQVDSTTNTIGTPVNISGVAGLVGSACSVMSVSSTGAQPANADDFKLFMNFYLLAKATGLQMTIMVDTASCTIIKFMLAAN